ncbi:nucleotidyltransferase family protein [Marinicella sp. S1101]|uniref:N-acetylmuramate alpha-1-phosphate uridylyltransferase MurU n=1 Tax=Marinicella marina TaxID=2996016 RepID=UPI0022609BC9|nr:nucleotidyltransferase family protein [Marinicella marina]MCX7553515.1 nucleotidyltransferase family protein [Marinicella marina]MDJ1140139.1 nucleotidyltransferase family protein [Marinicella marina]
MKALIFAAGRGERLKPLTDHTPKPLVNIKQKPLIQYHIEALMRAGVTEFIINASWLHQQIIEFINALTKKHRFRQINVQFSIEPNAPLETGGGLLKALPMLGKEAFIVVNADVFTDFDFNQLKQPLDDAVAHLVMVTNPSHNPEGDFSLKDGVLKQKSPNQKTYTYAGIGLYTPRILSPPFSSDTFSLTPHIKAAVDKQLITAHLHESQWHDVGTTERLNALNRR